MHDKSRGPCHRTGAAIDRRSFLKGATVGAAALTLPKLEGAGFRVARVFRFSWRLNQMYICERRSC